MKLHEKVKHIREERKFSQEHIAHQLGLSQSQYSRRENGEIRFITDEISQLAKVLETSISNLFGEETNSFSVHTQNGAISDNIFRFRKISSSNMSRGYWKKTK